MLEPFDAGACGELWDWRRRVAALYDAVREEPDPRTAWLLWRQVRDDLVRHHPQSALDPASRRTAEALPYFPYDPALRFSVRLRSVPATPFEVDAGPDGVIRLEGFARTAGLERSLGRELTVFWVHGYGGGAFLPFRDTTSGAESYGGGRYLLDTIKGADLGRDKDGLTVLDFNFAYNPSCSYSNRYICPLAPVENRLPVAIRAGEMRPVITPSPEREGV